MAAHEQTSRISVKVSPNSAKNEVVDYQAGVIKIKIAAAPERGKANKELIDFLSDKLAIRKSSIRILKGETGHNKILTIEGLAAAEVLRLLISNKQEG